MAQFTNAKRGSRALPDNAPPLDTGHEQLPAMRTFVDPGDGEGEDVLWRIGLAMSWTGQE